MELPGRVPPLAALRHLDQRGADFYEAWIRAASVTREALSRAPLAHPLPPPPGRPQPPPEPHTSVFGLKGHFKWKALLG